MLKKNTCCSISLNCILIANFSYWMKPCFFDTEFQLLPTFQNPLHRISRWLKQTEIKVRGIIFLSDFYAQSKVAKNPFDFYFHSTLLHSISSSNYIYVKRKIVSSRSRYGLERPTSNGKCIKINLRYIAFFFQDEEFFIQK